MNLWWSLLGLARGWAVNSAFTLHRTWGRFKRKNKTLSRLVYAIPSTYQCRLFHIFIEHYRVGSSYKPNEKWCRALMFSSVKKKKNPCLNVSFPFSLIFSFSFSAHELLGLGGVLAADFVTQICTVTCLPSPRGSICRFHLSMGYANRIAVRQHGGRGMKTHWFLICRILSIPLLYVFPGRTQANDSEALAALCRPVCWLLNLSGLLP